MKQGGIPYLRMAPCLFAIIIDAMGFGLVYPVMTLIFMSSHSPVLPVDASSALRHFYLGVGFMLYPLCMLFGTAFLSDCSDNFGRKRILSLCMLFIGLSFLLMALGVVFSSIWLLFIGRALSGLMAGSQPVAQASIADISTPETKAKNMGIVSLSYCFAVMLGPLIGGVTSDSSLWSGFNFSTPFFIAAVLAFLACVWVIVGFHDTFQPQGHKKLHLLRPLTLFVAAFKHPLIRLLVVAFVLMQLGYSIYFQFIVVHMQHAFHYSAWQLGLLNSMLGIGFGLGILVGLPIFLKFWSTKTIALITGVLTGVCLLLSGLIHFAAPQWALAILIAGFNMMLFTVMMTLFSDSVAKTEQGWAMGIFSAVIALSWTVTGFASNLIGSIGTNGLILLGGLIMLLGTLVVAFNRPREH